MMWKTLFWEGVEDKGKIMIIFLRKRMLVTSFRKHFGKNPLDV
jgi:hypothetical protein